MPYKIPESVLVVIYSGTSFLLLERADQPGFWQSVTGSRLDGERIEEAVRRELFEETGFESSSGILENTGRKNTYPIIEPWRSRYAPDVKENTEFVFHFRTTVRPAILSPGEHLRFEWVEGETAAARVFSSTNRAEIRRILARGEPSDK